MDTATPAPARAGHHISGGHAEVVVCGPRGTEIAFFGSLTRWKMPKAWSTRVSQYRTRSAPSLTPVIVLAEEARSVREASGAAVNCSPTHVPPAGARPDRAQARLSPKRLV